MPKASLQHFMNTGARFISQYGVPADPITSHQDRVEMLIKEVYSVTGYRFW